MALATHMLRARARLSPPFDVSLVEKNEVCLYMQIVPMALAPRGDVDLDLARLGRCCIVSVNM